MTEINKRVRDIADRVKSTTVFSNDFLSINPETKELGTKDSSHVVIKIDDVNFKVGGDIYEKNLPEGITLETIKNLKEYNSDFEAGVLLGVGESTLKLMKDSSVVMCSTAYISAGPGQGVSTYIGIHEDEDEMRINNGSMFSFQSHVKECMPIERLTGEPTQGQLVRKHLKELYTQTLCETVK